MVTNSQTSSAHHRNFWLVVRQEWLVWVVLMLALWLRLWRLDSPAQAYFDEVYHVPAAELMSRGDWSAFEWWHPPVDGVNYFDWLHPPLAKYAQAVSIWIGRDLFHSESAFWWRLPSALAGAATVYVVMKIVMNIGTQLAVSHHQNIKIQNGILQAEALAGLLVATDGLQLVQSRIAMNDALLSFLVTVFAWLVIRSKQAFSISVKTVWLAAVVVGLAMATKWTGIFVWFLFLGWQVGGVIWHRAAHSADIKRIQIIAIIFAIIIPWLVYFLSYAPAALSHAGYGHVIELHRQALLYHLNRDANHAYASRPWQWVLNLRPVWYWQDRDLVAKDATLSNSWRANIYAVSHPVLPVVTLFVLSWTVQQLLKQRKRSVLFFQLLFLGCLYVAVWMPWFFSPRIMFYYHYLPAIPLVAILMGLWRLDTLLYENKIAKLLTTILLIIWILGVVVWLPHWLGLRVPKELVDTIYFGLPGWR